MKEELNVEQFKQKVLKEHREALFHSWEKEVSEKDLETFVKLYNLDEELHSWFAEYCESHDKDLERTKEYILWERRQWQKSQNTIVQKFKFEIKWYEVQDLNKDLQESFKKFDKQEARIQLYSAGLLLGLVFALSIIFTISPFPLQIIIVFCNIVLSLNIIFNVVYNFGTITLHTIAYLFFLPFMVVIDLNGAITQAIRKRLNSK